MAHDIFRELQEIVDRMAELDGLIDEHHAKRDVLQEKLRLIRARHHVAVSLERDENGKPLYPSEKVREAAITVRLAEDSEYLATRKEIRSMDGDAEFVLEFNRLADRKYVLVLEIQAKSGDSSAVQSGQDKRSKRFQRP